MTFIEPEGREPDAQAVQLKEVLLPNHPASVSVARQELCLVGEVWGLAEDTIDRAETCVSELATNSVRYAPKGKDFRLVLLRRGDRLRAELYDSGRDFPVLGGVAGDFDEGGRGLFIIGCYADDHGITLTNEGKSVWAEFTAWPT